MGCIGGCTGIACVATVSVRIGSKESKTARKMRPLKEQRGGGKVRKEQLADNLGF